MGAARGQCQCLRPFSWIFVPDSPLHESGYKLMLRSHYRAWDSNNGAFVRCRDLPRAHGNEYLSRLDSVAPTFPTIMSSQIVQCEDRVSKTMGNDYFRLEI